MQYLLFLLFIALAGCGKPGVDSTTTKPSVGAATPVANTTGGPANTPGQTMATSRSTASRNTGTGSGVQAAGSAPISAPTSAPGGGGHTGGAAQGGVKSLGGGTGQALTTPDELLVWPDKFLQAYKNHKTLKIAIGITADMDLSTHKMTYFVPKISEELAKRITIFYPQSLFNTALNETWADKVVVASSLKSITDKYNDFLNDGEEGLAFVNASGEWKNPIPGEVRIIGDLRFQFIEEKPVASEPYSIVAFSRPKDITNLQEKVLVPIPWKPEDLVLLGQGSKGAVTQVSYNERTFVAKTFFGLQRGISAKAEIDAYEKLSGVEGIGPYLGWVGGHLSSEDGSPKWSSNTVLLLDLGLPMKEVLEDAFSPVDPESFFEPLLKTVGEMHKRQVFHSDIKILNMIMVKNKPHIIDFDNYAPLRITLSKGGGFTAPYYKEGDQVGIKADLRALGFSFFEMKYRKNNGFTRHFKEDFNKYFKGNLLDASADPTALANELETTGDKNDQMIARLLKKQFADAEAALTFLKAAP